MSGPAKMQINKLAFSLATACVVGILGLTWLSQREESGDRPRAMEPKKSHDDVATTSSYGGNTTPVSRELQAASVPAGLPSQEQMLAQSLRDMQKHEANWNLAPATSPWAQATERRLAELVESPAMQEIPFRPTEVVSRCKATLCRVEASFKSNIPANEWNTRTLLGMGAAFGASTIVQVPGENGKVLHILYAYR